MRRIWWWCTPRNPMRLPWIKPFAPPGQHKTTLWTAEVWDVESAKLIRSDLFGQNPGWDKIINEVPSNPNYVGIPWPEGQSVEVVDVERVWDWDTDGHDGAWDDGADWWERVLARTKMDVIEGQSWGDTGVLEGL